MAPRAPVISCQPFPSLELLALSSAEDQESYNRLKSLWDNYAPRWCDEVRTTVLINARKIKCTKSNRDRPSAHILWRDTPWNLGHWVLMYCIYKKSESKHLSRMRDNFMTKYANIELYDFGHPCFQRPLIVKEEEEPRMSTETPDTEIERGRSGGEAKVPDFQPNAEKRKRQLSSIPESEVSPDEGDEHRSAKRVKTTLAGALRDILGIPSPPLDHKHPDNNSQAAPHQAPVACAVSPAPLNPFSTFKQRINDATNPKLPSMSLGPAAASTSGHSQGENGANEQLAGMAYTLSRIESSVGSMMQRQSHIEKQLMQVMDRLTLLNDHVERVGKQVIELKEANYSERFELIERYLDSHKKE